VIARGPWAGADLNLPALSSTGSDKQAPAATRVADLRLSLARRALDLGSDTLEVDDVDVAGSAPRE
jgi:hypothetical protein